MCNDVSPPSCQRRLFENPSASAARMPTRWAAIFLGLVLAVGIFGCDNAPKENTSVKEKMAVSTSRFGLSGLLYLAKEKGLFEKHGLDVAIDTRPSGRQAVEAMFAGQTQVALTAELPIAKAIMTGKRLAILGSLGEGIGDNQLVGRKDRGIADPKDLVGKTIAVETGTTAEYLVDAILGEYGIGRDQVRIVSLSVDKIGEALASGEVDAGCGFHPYVLEWQRQLGDNAYSYVNPRLYSLTWYAVAASEYAAAHDAALKKFFAALRDAERLHQAEPQTMRQALINAGIPGEIHDANLYRFALRFDQSAVLTLEGLSRWALRRNLVPPQPVPNYLDAFVAGPLRAVKPEAVTVIRDPVQEGAAGR
jgi:NitT/TauT family transport system substrate-binding protein